MRIRNWKLKTLGKVIAFVSLFLVLILLINHSYTRKMLSRKPLGNFEPIHVRSRGGAGEEGRAHHTREDQEHQVRDSLSKYGINIVGSSEISLSRSLPDLRLDECKYWQYSENLPAASVIIVFYNEGLSLLLRNINSILNRTPRKFLEEIILVDDFSDKLDLGLKLEMQVEKFGGVVKIVRQPERQGLIRARITGAMHARGKVLVYLDAHCEVNVNWLPPLLQPIQLDRKVITIPIIDGIDKDTFEYTSNYNYDKPSKGIFSWGMLNKEIELTFHEMALLPNRTTPYRTPTHQGGLFAIEKDYFAELGHYDDELLVWGAENLELSFKVWQCGGTMLWVPCSRVGHVFRSSTDRLGDYHPPRDDYVTSNFRRVVETWLDEKYKEFYYTMQPFARFVDMGNISKQLALRKRLHCNSFEWYMEYVARDVYRHFPPPPVNTHWGQLVNMATGECVDLAQRRPPGEMAARRCDAHRGQGQIMRLNSLGQLGKGEWCVTAGNSNRVKLASCTLGVTEGPWRYEERDMILINGDVHKCLGQHPMTRRLMLLPCDTRNTFLQWKFRDVRR